MDRVIEAQKTAFCADDVPVTLEQQQARYNYRIKQSNISTYNMSHWKFIVQESTLVQPFCDMIGSKFRHKSQGLFAIEQSAKEEPRPLTLKFDR